MLWTKNLSSNSDLIAKKDRSHNFKFFRLRRLPDYMVYTEHILLTTWASNCTYMTLLKTANYLTLQLSIFPLKAYFQHKVQWAEHIPWVYILLLTAKLPVQPCTRRSLEWSKKWTTAIKNFHLSRLLLYLQYYPSSLLHSGRLQRGATQLELPGGDYMSA